MGSVLKNDQFNAKLLLFGEYTVLTGSSSLAVPFSGYHFSYCQTGEDQFRDIIEKFYNYLNAIDFSSWGTRFYANEYSDAFRQGLFFESNIPIGYGLGSSGALTAAVYSRFFKPLSDPSPEELKSLFSKMEGFFHGKSSGMDPLIIYLNKAVYTKDQDQIIPIEFDLSSFGDLSLSLINSGISRRTGKFVSVFNDKITDESYFNDQIMPISGLNDEIIRALIEKDKSFDLFGQCRTLSSRQFNAFSEMIPKPISSIWKDCLDRPDDAIKLCGAGGGGFYFLLSRNLPSFIDRYPQSEVINIHN